MKIIKKLIAIFILLVIVVSVSQLFSVKKYEPAKSDNPDPVVNALERFAREVMAIDELLERRYADEFDWRLKKYNKEISKVEKRIRALMKELDEKKDSMTEKQLNFYLQWIDRLYETYPNFDNFIDTYDKAIKLIPY